VFRRLTGLSVHAYRIELRQRLALEPLAAESVSVSRVAADLGFASHSHLTATLRMRLGLTPTRLRRVLLGLDAGGG
jgi:AraC-like DNA-binding protein